ncbi:MAG: hypothetical protein P1R58_07720 [bacterium]|nr:hypothetical protein [bacterium]
MRGFLLTALLTFAILSASTQAAETSVHGRLYADWMMKTTELVDNDFADTIDGFNEFQISRAYVTVKSKLSDRTSVRITSDIKAKDGLYNIMLKYGYIDWKPAFGGERLMVRFGLQPTQYIDAMNKVWGRRYLAKTVSDANSYLTSSDLGASAFFSLGTDKKLGVVSVTLFNGTKYSDTREMNKNKDINIYGAINPLKNNENLKKSVLMAQAYLGTQNKDISAATVDAADYKKELISVGGALVYKSLLDIGFDVNMLTLGEGPNNPDNKESGISFFGTLYLADLAPESQAFRTLGLFGRLDMVDPDTDTDNDATTTMIAGVECSPVKGFKAAVNYRNTSYDETGVDSEGALYLNTLFKF